MISLYGLATGTYLLVFALASLKKQAWHGKDSENLVNRIAILLPVYKEDDIILDSASRALLLNYDPKCFDVIVIADSLKPSTCVKLETMGCKVVIMDLTPRSKAKALNLALRELPETSYDIALVLDADNYLSHDALIEINNSFNHGAIAVQCKRVAREITTPLENLEAISEAINNNLFRKGHRALGLSAALAGSGMAFDYRFFTEVMRNIHATNGFDKDLEFEILSSGASIEYLENVHVFDEKISSLKVLKNQRIRWFAAQLLNISKGVKFVFKNPSADVIDKWWQMFLLSRLLLFGMMISVSIVSFVAGWIPFAYLTGVASIMIGASLLIAMPRQYFNKSLLPSIIKIPVSFFTLVVSLLSFRRAFKGFIHTPHSSKPKTI